MKRKSHEIIAKKCPNSVEIRHRISCLTPFTDVEIDCNTPAERKPAPHQPDLLDFMSVALPAFVKGPARHLNRPSASFPEKHLRSSHSLYSEKNRWEKSREGKN